MKKVKNLTFLLIIQAILFGVYNLLVFIIDFEHTSTFWVSYGFSITAFVLSISTLLLLFKKADAEAVFLGIPLLSLSVFYFYSTVGINFIFMAISGINWKISLVINVLLVAAFLIFSIFAIMSRNAIENKRDQIAEKVNQHKSFNIDIDMLYTTCTNPLLKEKLRKLSETVKYSDPMSNDAVADVEKRISMVFTELRIYCENAQIEEAEKLTSQLEMLYLERNNKLKISK